MENLTGGTPPVRCLPCVVPCKLYFADIKNGLWDLYEDIVAAEEGYIQADTDAAKAMDGVSEGGISLSDY